MMMMMISGKEMRDLGGSWTAISSCVCVCSVCRRFIKDLCVKNEELGIPSVRSSVLMKRQWLVCILVS